MKLRDSDIEYLEEAKKLIDKDMSKHYTILEIARHVGLSESRLTRGFKFLFNLGLFEYLEEARLENAKNMIENTDKRFKEVSKVFGYKYSNNFSKAFKKRFGISPRTWKKSCNRFDQLYK